MELNVKLASRDINELLWRNKKTLGTAESCTGGRIASVITAIPGSSSYYKGGIICYSNLVKTEILGVDAAVIAEQTAVCEDVVKQLVIGTNKLLHTDYAVAVSGFAGPATSNDTTSAVPVGTIWIAVGQENDIVTLKLEEDNGRDLNLANATEKAIHLLLDYLRERCEPATVR